MTKMEATRRLKRRHVGGVRAASCKSSYCIARRTIELNCKCEQQLLANRSQHLIEINQRLNWNNKEAAANKEEARAFSQQTQASASRLDVRSACEENCPMLMRRHTSHTTNAMNLSLEMRSPKNELKETTANTNNTFNMCQNIKSSRRPTRSGRFSVLSSTLLAMCMPLLLLLLCANKQATGQLYKPDWPQKLIEQEIFLLNLEDGYFGCQVNASQDFLQLFELSRLCDGQPQCYLGSDELAQQLKCRERDRCEMSGTSANQLIGEGGTPQQQLQQSGDALTAAPVKCVNGVCLDGLCYCNDGFGGKSCDIPDENECKFRPCDVFAHCTNTMGSYYCSCFPGYDGDGMHCQDINECEVPSLRALCSDNSECVNLPGHFVCKCKSGYQQAGLSQQSQVTGAPIGNATVQCTDIDECSVESTCGRGAICENLPGSFKCSCPAGFGGDPLVECIDMDECRNNPCGTGAQCTNIPGGYKCSCAPGHERNPAAPAHLFGTIQIGQFNSDQQQHANNSLIACLDINECTQQTTSGKGAVCGVGAQCVNTPGAYFCQCPPGFVGNPKLSCTDVDECASHACGPNAQCKNTPGSYKCECKAGFSGNAYSSEGCQDEDECLRLDACGLNAQCFNTLGGFQCTCQSGFEGDAYKKCVDIDECAPGSPSPCGPGAQCQNLVGGYKCACPDKYLARGTPEMGCERAAVDVSCSSELDCSANAACVNATCQCKLGYQISGIECVDVNECLIGQQLQQQQLLLQQAPVKAFTRLNLAAQQQQQQLALANVSASHLCGPEATCVNTEGAYECKCKSGYEKIAGDLANSKCRDVNECERQPDVCGPNSKCFNTDGGFNCKCNVGFVPADATHEGAGCKSPCDGVNCGQHAACKPHGEEAACVCKPGFTFDPSNIDAGCVDINECDPQRGPSGACGPRAVCTNTPGSYRCSCPAGYAGDAYRYCEDINECDRKFGVFGQCGELAVCTNRAGSFSCSCAPGYAGDPKVKCTDVDECASAELNKCGSLAECTNLPGKFACSCPAGFTGDPHVECTPELAACTSGADCAKNQLCQAGRCVCPYASQPGDVLSPATTPNATNRALECRHPCDRVECGAHATCQLDGEQQPLCVCDAGYIAPSDGRSGCVDVNECIQGAASVASGMTPLAGAASIALGNQANATANGAHPCGRNALCRNQPGSFDCVCPAGYSGDAYVACTLDVRNQQQAAAQNSTASDSLFGQYQQEPRTTACSEPCARGLVCADGQCVRRDACRDHDECRQSQACELVNQALGFQCVGVCEQAAANKCGPGAKCVGQNHKAVCVCTSGLRGNPYDLVDGCNARTTTTTKQDQYQEKGTSSQQEGGDISTVSFGGGGDTSAGLDQQQQQVSIGSTTSAFNSSTTSSTSSSSSTNDEQAAHRQQVGERQPALIAYELPLPTTPLVPQSQTTTTGLRTSEQFDLSGRLNYSASPQQTPSDQSTGGDKSQPIYSTTFSRPQQQQQQQHSTTSAHGLFTTKRRPTTTQQKPVTQEDELSTLKQTFEQRQDIQTTQASKSGISQQQVNGEQQVGEFVQQSSQFNSNNNNNKTTSEQHNQLVSVDDYKQVACTSDQHCPGNLFCLPVESFVYGDAPVKSGHQKICACPHEYRREGDYCFVHRVNCTSTSVCRAREECVATSSSSSSSSTNSRQHQQTGTSQQFSLVDVDSPLTGVCICPRGYKLTAAGLACVDRNECDEGTPCALGAICQNKIGSYECVCPPGTSGEPYTKTCEPLGRVECLTNGDCANDRECDLASRKCVSPCHVCGPRAICTATNHAAICLCPPRFTGNAIDQVYGCREPQQVVTTTSTPTTTTNSPTNAPTTTTSSSTTQRPTSTAVGVPVTTLLPATSTSTTLAPLNNDPSTTTNSPSGVEQPEYRTIPPTELFVMCLADGIHVDLQLEKFDGIIYVKGHSQDPKCRKLVMSNGSPNQMVDFKVQFGHCDLIHRDGEAGFVLVIQKHPKLVTYRARAYHVKCVYNTGERTVTLGFNVSMITTSGTIANTGPPPTCLMSITALDGREVTSAEIGQDLLLRVDVQPDSIYGGFARSCEAKTMDDEGEYQYEVTDANGCATDASIFSDWQYDQHRKSLVARFNAFKFPSSNNLRFQCNIRVCFGSCPPVNCNGIDAYGKRRRRRDAPASLLATNSPNSTEFDSDTEEELIVGDTFKEGALREEIMVQSNAILTFDKKEASLPQQRPPVEDIEFVCLPRLGIVMSILLTTLLALLALAMAMSCWCFAKKKQRNPVGGQLKAHNGPLPHPVNFPNPLMRSSSASTLRESLYGP